MQLTFMYNIVLLYMLIFLVADCVCGVVGTSFLVMVGQHEDSWVGSILRHIQVGPRRVIRRPMWRTRRTTRSQLPESRRTLSPLVISRLYMICNPRPLVCYTSLGASSSIVYTHAQCLVFTCTLYTPLSLIYSTRSRLFLQLQLNSSMCMCLFHIIDPQSESGLKYRQWMIFQFIYKQELVHSMLLV